MSCSPSSTTSARSRASRSDRRAGAESAEGFYARIPINMAVQGNYHEIAMFMQEVANLRRIVNVTISSWR